MKSIYYVENAYNYEYSALRYLPLRDRKHNVIRINACLNHTFCIYHTVQVFLYLLFYEALKLLVYERVFSNTVPREWMITCIATGYVVCIHR